MNNNNNDYSSIDKAIALVGRQEFEFRIRSVVAQSVAPPAHVVTDCRFTVLQQQPNGYVRLQVAISKEGRQIKQAVSLHRAIHYIHTGEQCGPGEDCSHLCNQPLCTNHLHLCIEPHDVNVSRIYCRLFGNLYAHVHNCLHIPKCTGL